MADSISTLVKTSITGAGQVSPDGRHRSTRALGVVRAVPLPGGPASVAANDFYFLAHDDRTGRPRLFGAAVAHGLAAGLLIELLYERKVTFERGHLRVVDPRPPVDPLQGLVLRRLTAEPQHTRTRTWLAVLAESAARLVADRMWHAGLVEPVRVGRLWRTRTVYLPTDVNVAAWPWARMSQQVRTYRVLDDVDVALGGLAVHTGLDAMVLDGAPSDARAHLRAVVEHAWPPLRDLFADLGSAIGGRVLCHRT